MLLSSISTIILLLGTGLPVFLVFLFAGTAWVLIQFGTRGFGLLTNSIYSSGTSETFIAVPLFVLMGELLFRSGSLDKLFDAADVVVGRVRGRKYVLVIVVSVILGALSGSSVAVAAMLGATVLPQAVRLGSDRKLIASSILGGASLAPIIPPSIVVIIIGSLVPNVSISSLLMAGVGPGIMMAGMLIVFAVLKAPPEKEPARIERPGFGNALKRIAGALPFAVVIASITGMIIGGIATPTESAATGVLGALVVTIIYRRLSISLLRNALLSATLISASILAIVLSAQLFGQLLSMTGTTRELVQAIAHLELEPFLLIAILILIPLLFCMFLDNLAFLMLATPLYEPIVTSYAIEPVWFWTVFAFSLTIGSVSPPFGYTVFALQGASAPILNLKEIYASAWPVVGIFVVGLVVLLAFPPIATWIPSLILK